MREILILLTFLISSLSFANEEVKEAGLRSLWSLNHIELMTLNDRYVKRLAKKIERGQIIGLELITAASTDSKIESRFGHSMIRFIDTTPRQSDDLTLSFVADVDEPNMSYLGGVYGKYPVFPMIKPTRDFVRDYIKIQGRYLKRNIMPATQEQRYTLAKKIIQWWNEIQSKEARHYQEELQKKYEKANKFGLKEFGQDQFALIPLTNFDAGEPVVTAIVARSVSNPDQQKIFHLKIKAHKVKELGKYKFFSNNCAGALYRYLKNNGMPYYTTFGVGRLGVNGRIPSKLALRLEKSLLNPYPELVVNKLLKLLEKINDDYENRRFSYLDQTLGLEEKALLLDFKAELPTDIKVKWTNEVKVERFTYGQIHGITKVNPALYNVCGKKNVDCQNEVKTALQTTFTSISGAKKKRIIKYSKRNRRGLRKSPLHREHHQWLSDILKN
ncbi:MAG: DUF4105 domain-containing protein [Oligoflexia bacterium]|nr:DUF4105 domain-containing protein [Oligoflexia bacterium]